MEKKRVDNFWRVIHLCTPPSYLAYLSAYFNNGIMTYVKKSKLAAAAAPVLAALISIIGLPGCMVPPRCVCCAVLHCRVRMACKGVQRIQPRDHPEIQGTDEAVAQRASRS